MGILYKHQQYVGKLYKKQKNREPVCPTCLEIENKVYFAIFCNWGIPIPFILRIIKYHFKAFNSASLSLVTMLFFLGDKITKKQPYTSLFFLMIYIN